RIGAGAELVDEHERLWRRGNQNLTEILEMRAERRETRLDRLLVTDVGKQVVEDGDAASGGDRRGHSGLHERRDERDRLEQYRLSASVRPGHEQRPLARTHLEIERN